MHKALTSFHLSHAAATHPITAVDGWDKHDSHQYNESGDEEAHHQAGAADTDTVRISLGTHDVYFWLCFMAHCLFVTVCVVVSQKQHLLLFIIFDLVWM